MGCAGLEGKSRCGFHFEILKPPVIESNTPIIVNMGPGMTGVNAIGATAGPITESRTLSAPLVAPYAPPLMTPCAPPAALPSRLYAPECVPQQAPLSMEDMCRAYLAQQQLRAPQRMPGGPEKLHAPKQSAPGDCP